MMEAVTVNRVKISQRINRFGRQELTEGNKNVRKKISIDELVKTLVSKFLQNISKWDYFIMQLVNIFDIHGGGGLHFDDEGNSSGFV